MGRAQLDRCLSVVNEPFLGLTSLRAVRSEPNQVTSGAVGTPSQAAR